MIDNHLRVCEECQIWVQDHGDDWHQWVVDPGPLRTGYLEPPWLTSTSALTPDQRTAC